MKYKPHNPEFAEDDLTPVKMNPKEEDIYTRVGKMVETIWPSKMSLVRSEMKSASLDGELPE